MPEEKIGTIKMTGVTKNGMAFNKTLRAETILKTTFGSEGPCSLRGTQVVVPSLTGNVECKNGRCRGALLQVARLTADCVRTSITSEFVSFRIFDSESLDPNAVVAAPGTFLAPLR